jgi:hypothetical protein
VNLENYLREYCNNNFYVFKMRENIPEEADTVTRVKIDYGFHDIVVLYVCVYWLMRVCA